LLNLTGTHLSSSPATMGAEAAGGGPVSGENQPETGPELTAASLA
jgi:hypothetical protein